MDCPGRCKLKLAGVWCQGYILSPEIFKELPKDRFLIKAMSFSYISREIMDRLSVKDDITYHYRRVAKNAQNKASSPTGVESDLIGLFNGNREITLEKEMMPRIQQAERPGVIGKLAAGIAHEINNPLGVIQCYTDLVKDAVADKGGNKDIDVIVRQTRTVQKIVQDHLNLSRPKLVISDRCCINQVAGAAIQIFKAQAASKQIRVIPKLGDDLPPIKCDAAILEQILTNIWLNAFDALQETGGEVIISTQATQGGNEPHYLGIFTLSSS
ncbi:MAG: hypothetical protein JEZ12_21780 [Desulfobacterium sp.]|nr:hypothetical protein [Desulfobacterium sp.]